MQTAKTKITTAVNEYKRLFPEEYKLFLKGNQITIESKKDKFATTGNKISALERHLYDVPEKLHSAIYQMLNEHEYEWYTSRGEYSKTMQAPRWFIETFPEFKVTQTF